MRGKRALSVGLCAPLVVFCIVFLSQSLCHAGNEETMMEAASDQSIQWFEDRTSDAGVAGEKPYGFSLAWIDFNYDSFPDLFIGPHHLDFRVGRIPKLFINQGDGTFVDIASKAFLNKRLNGDTHGVAWGDFDNDGDPDLYLAVGAQLGQGSSRNFFFINEAGELREAAKERSLTYALGRGRSGFWFDLQQDGLLDLLMVNATRPDRQAPTALFVQKDGNFEEAGSEVGFHIEEPARFATLADVTGDGQSDLVVHGNRAFPLRVYKLSDGKLIDVTKRLPRVEDLPDNPANDFADHRSARDVVIADFNGDLYPDIFMTRCLHLVNKPQLLKASDGALVANLSTLYAPEIGLSFRAKRRVQFEFSKKPAFDFVKDKILVGSAGTPMTQPTFTLDPGDPGCWGVPEAPADARRAVLIGYDDASGLWRVRYVGPRIGPRKLRISSRAPITNVKTVNFAEFNPSANALQDVLWIYDPAARKYVDRTVESGLGKRTLGQTVVAGDFDNDMDVDLYISCSGPMENVENILCENQGDGTFRAVPGAGGAPSVTLGAHLMEYGIAQRAAVADYDLDGFLDIFLGPTTWKSNAAGRPGAAATLYRNVGNANHWIQVDLEGVYSNRDGTGARVVARAGGVSQLREKAGGMHLFAQDMSRIHFGLGQNKKVNALEITWPSGVKQILRNIPSNQLITVRENRGLDGDDTLVGTARNERLYGGKGNDVVYGRRGDDVVDGGRGNDMLFGGPGNDVLHGREGDDKLFGGPGDDVLFGGLGVDEMHGGKGADRFVFRSTKHSGVGRGNRDVILDFSSAEGDRIDLRRIGALTFVGRKAFSRQGQGEIRWFVDAGSSSSVVEIDSDGDGLADSQIQLTGSVQLQAGDFVTD